MIKLVLAAGDADRWQGQRAKQLVQIGEELLLERTQRQAEECTVVTHLSAIRRFAARHFEPERRRWIVETAISTMELWEDRVVLLLGDVIYSDETMARILASTKPVAVFGRRWEIYAVTFGAGAVAQVVEALVAALADAALGGRGKLWEFYKSLCGFPYHENRLEDKIFCMVEDYTDDIDTAQEYYQFLEYNPWARGSSGPAGLLGPVTLVEVERNEQKAVTAF